MRCINESAIVSISCYLTRYTVIDTTGLDCLLQEIIGDLPAVNNNDKFLVKFRSGTLRIIDTVKLMSLMSLF